MGYKRQITLSALCAAIVVAATAPSFSASREPLIVTPLHNPDPGLAAQLEPQLKLTLLRDGDDERAALDQAIASVGRAIGEAARADQEAIESKCRSGQADAASTADRFAWAANCRYRRR